MINVQPYIDKLEVLKEYMNLSIDRSGMRVWLRLEAMPTLSIDQILNFFWETGVALYSKDKEVVSETKTLSFEEYLESKTK